MAVFRSCNLIAHKCREVISLSTPSNIFLSSRAVDVQKKSFVGSFIWFIIPQNISSPSEKIMYLFSVRSFKCFPLFLSKSILIGGCQLNNDAISFQLPLTWNLAKSAIVRSTISRVLDTTIDFLLKRANQCLCLPLFCSRYTVCDLL